MDLEIIGVGFGRTGTDSTREALNQLGFPCYHMREVLSPKNRGHLDFWNDVANAPAGTQHDWQQVFENYRASVDNPAAATWRELIEAYPDAKVLLTLHPKGPETWYESTVETIYSPQTKWQYKVLALLTPFGKKMQNMTKRLIWDRFHAGTMSDKDAAIEHYEAHVRTVREVVPEDRLLVFRASDGWEPLCEFVGKPVPEGPFPRINDRKEMQRRMRGGEIFAYLLLVACGAVLWGAGYLIYRLLGG